AFSGWQGLGGNALGSPANAIQSPPAVAAPNPGQRDIFGLVGSDGPGRLWHLETGSALPQQWMPRPGTNTLGDLIPLHPTLAVYTVLKSTNGGVSWQETRNAVPAAAHRRDLGTVAGNQGTYNNTIAVHPTNTSEVAIGWRSDGAFISRDA